ncbi:unnamed protein product [Calypogeia fissa]
MAATFSSQLSLLLAHDRSSSSAYTSSSSSSSTPTLRNAKSRSGLVSRSSLRHSGAILVASKGSGSRKRLEQIAGAKRPGKDRDGALAEAVEEAKVPENSEPLTIWKGRKLEGLEPDFWEGEQWDLFGFIIQYLWAIGLLIALGACGVAVTSYNSGASDIRDTEVFKEALENQVEADSSFDSDSFQDFPEPTEAPSVE